MRKAYAIAFLAVLASASFLSASAGAKTTLQVWDWYQDRMDFLKPKAEEYMRLHPDIEIKLSMVDWTDYPSKVLASVIGGTPPEIIEFHNSWTGYLLKVLAPFPPELFSTSKMTDEYYQFNTAFRMKDGKFYFFPDGLMSSEMFYNTRLWSQAGLAGLPETWDELRFAAKKLAKLDGNGKMTQTGFDFDIQYLWDDLNYQMGGGLYNDKQTGCDFNSTEGRKAMDLVQQLTFNDRIKPVGRDAMPAFDSGKVGIYNSWGWRKSSYVKIPAKNLQWSVFGVPTSSGSLTAIRGRNNYECGYAVPANLKSTKKLEAFKFLKWLYSDDVWYVKLNDAMGRLPGKKTLWTRPELANDAMQSSMVKTIPYTVFPGERPSWIDDILTRMQASIMGQKSSPADALRKAQEDADKQWKIQPPKWIVEKRLPK